MKQILENLLKVSLSYLTIYLFTYLLTYSFVIDTYENVYSKYVDRSQNSSTTSAGGVNVKPKSSFSYLYSELSEGVIESRISDLKDKVKEFKIRYKVVFNLLTYSITWSLTSLLPLVEVVH